MSVLVRTQVLIPRNSARPLPENTSRDTLPWNLALPGCLTKLSDLSFPTIVCYYPTNLWQMKNIDSSIQNLLQSHSISYVHFSSPRYIFQRFPPYSRLSSLSFVVKRHHNQDNLQKGHLIEGLITVSEGDHYDGECSSQSVSQAGRQAGRHGPGAVAKGLHLITSKGQREGELGLVLALRFLRSPPMTCFSWQDLTSWSFLNNLPAKNKSSRYLSLLGPFSFKPPYSVTVFT